jgi:hypothetical protein
MYVCSVATKVIEIHFKILSQIIKPFLQYGHLETEHLLIHTYETNQGKKNVDTG